MKQLLDPNSPLMQKMAYLFDMVALSALFTICALPIVTAGAAAAGLIRTIRQRIDQEDVTPITYFRNMRYGWKPATLFWLLLLVLGVLLFLDFRIVGYMPETLRFLMIIVIFILLICLLLIVVSGFALVDTEPNLTIRQLLVKALLTSIAQLPKAILVILCLILPFLLLVFVPKAGLAAGFLWAFLWPSLVSWLVVKLLVP